MSEYQQRHSNTVTIEEYDASKVWRATAEDIASTLVREPDEDDKARGKFTMRLLENNNSGDSAHAASDYLVEVIGKGNTAAESADGPLTVVVQAILRDNETGPLQTVSVAPDGLILNSNSNTPNFEKGYFLGGEGIGEDEILDHALHLLVPKERLELKAMEAPLEFEREW